MVNRKLRKSLEFIFCFGLIFPQTAISSISCSKLFTRDSHLSTLLSKTERPKVSEIKSLLSTAEGKKLKKQHVRQNEETLFRTYQAAVIDLINKSNGRTVYLFARDGEWIHDAVQSVLSSHSDGKKLVDRFKLINVSRLIARNHTPEQLQGFLESNGMDINGILSGKEKVVWVDTGNRGSIFLNLYQALFEKINFKLPQNQVAEQIENVLKGIEGLLIASRNPGNKSEILRTIKDHKWANAAEVSALIGNRLFFDEFLVDYRVSLGIPEDRYQRYRWVVENIEHTPHFNGRASALSSDGKSIISVENDPFAIREESIALQMRIVERFSDPEFVKTFTPYVSAAARNATSPSIKPKLIATTQSSQKRMESKKKSVDAKLVEIKEVLELVDKDLLPHSTLEDFDLNQVAQSLVSRVRAQEGNLGKRDHEFPTSQVDLKNDSDIILFFKSNDITAIQNSGFLNQHQTGTSGGALRMKDRLQAEDRVTGVQLGTSQQALELRPKSAFLNIRSDVKLADKSVDPSVQFGDIGAVLNESLKDRSIWTSGDSLSLGLFMLAHGLSDYTAGELYRHRGTFERKSLLSYTTDKNYYEALVYGAIELSDVQYFIVTESSKASHLFHLGKPVYLADKQMINGRVVFKKGQLLTSGSEGYGTPSWNNQREKLDQVFTAAGLPDKVDNFVRNWFVAQSYEATEIWSNRGKYLIYTKNQSELSFARIRKNLNQDLDSLQKLGFKTKDVIFVGENVILQQGIVTERSLHSVHPDRRREVRRALIKFIQFLAEKKMYVKGMGPESLLFDTWGDLVIRTVDGLRPKHSSIDVINRYIETLSSRWEEYFGPGDFASLIASLEHLKANLPLPEPMSISTNKVFEVDPAQLKIGDRITTPNGNELELIGEGGVGRRGLVVKVRDVRGNIFALKVAKNNEVETIRSFSEENTKANGAMAAGFRTTKILESGSNYHLKEWAQGILAEDWVRQWSENGFRQDDPALISLKRHLRVAASRGLYTGDLNRKNMIWDGANWIVIDSGATTNEYAPGLALERYFENISSRWSKGLSSVIKLALERALKND